MLFQGEHWLFVGILGCLPPALHLLWVQASLLAVGAEFGGIQPSGLEHHRELVGGSPALRILLRCRHHFSLQPPGLPLVVEGDNVNAQLCRDLGHALPVRRTHPPSHINFDGLAVATHCSAPSSPLVVKVVGMERRQLSWQRGWAHSFNHISLNSHAVAVIKLLL